MSSFTDDLKRAMSLQPSNVVYPNNEKPAVDVDMSLCTEEEKPRMISMVNRLAKSELGKETLEIAAKDGFKLGFFTSKDCAGAADPISKTIVLNSRFCDDMLMSTLCHEARHAGQISRSQGVDEAILNWDVKTNLIYKRAMEADAQAYASCACEELSLKGDKMPKEEFKKFNPEIAVATEKALSENKNEITPEVLTQSFQAWYDQNRMKTAYENAYIIQPMRIDLNLAALMEKVADTNMQTFSTSISAKEAISELAWTKKGNYFKDKPEILNTGKYMDVSEASMEQMKKYFEYRKEFTGKDDSKCLEGIPVRPNTKGVKVAKMKKPWYPKIVKKVLKPFLEEAFKGKDETQEKAVANKALQLQMRRNQSR